MIKVYLDSNVFIFSLNPNTNSYIILRTALALRFSSVISHHVLDEVKNHLSRHYGKDVASAKISEIYLISSLTTVEENKLAPMLGLYSHLITDSDDLQHITASIIENCDYFVTTNRKLSQMKAKSQINFITPKEFVEILGMTSINTKNEE